MTRRKPRRPGRPTLLTPDTQNRILRAIRNGTPVTAAAHAAGISPSTFMLWQARGNAAAEARDNGEEVPENELRFIEFVELCVRARAEGLENRLAKVAEIAEGGFVVKETTRSYQSKQGPVEEVERQFAPPDWRALAWVLERSHREFFGRADRVELSGPGGGPVEVAHSEVEGLAARIRAHVSQRVDSIEGVRAVEAASPRVIEGVVEPGGVEGEAFCHPQAGEMQTPYGASTTGEPPSADERRAS